MRYLISFSYDGSCFTGFQKQKNKRTIQGLIEQYLSKLEGKEVKLHASGRTDKGVHAKDQKAHFDLDKKVSLYSLKKYLNRSFNNEIYINDIKIVSDDFHARYNVKSKTYSYYINTGLYNVFDRNYVYQYCNFLDIDKMKEAVNVLIGTHDFRSFTTDSKDKENCIRTIKDISITKDKDIIKITFTGDGFLRKMIRNIMSVLIEIGASKKNISYMNEVLNLEKREGNLKCAPAEGLYLEKVIF